VSVALCSWKTRVYRTSCLGAGQHGVLAGRAPAKGRSRPSPFPSEFLKAPLWRGRRLCGRGCFSGSGGVPACPGPSALQPQGQLFGRISQSTRLRVTSLRLRSRSHFSLQAQTRGDKLFPVCLIDKSCRTRKAHSWLPESPWQKATAQ